MFISRSNLDGADVSDRRMTPGHVVEPLDVVEHVGSCLIPGGISFALDAFGLQRREEALHRRVVPHVAGSTHAADDAAVSQMVRCFATKTNFMSLPSRRRRRPFLGCPARPSAW